MTALSNEEFFRFCMKFYFQELSKHKDDEYEVNQPQMEKLLDILGFFLENARENGGHVEPVELIPHVQSGGVNAKFQVFDVYGKDVQKFCKVLSYASCFSMDVTDDDKVYISVGVPNVFVPKEA